jgi:hypothetical protein
MKPHFLMPGVILLLCSCMAVEQQTGTAKMSAEFVGKQVFLKKDLYLHHAEPHQFDFTPFVLRRGKMIVPRGESAPLEFLETWEQGKRLSITAVKSVRQSGARWIIFLGSAYSERRRQEVAFEYSLGLTDASAAVPFAVVK